MNSINDILTELQGLGAKMDAFIAAHQGTLTDAEVAAALQPVKDEIASLVAKLP